MSDLDQPSLPVRRVPTIKCEDESIPVKSEIEKEEEVEVVSDDLEEKAENMVEIYDLDSFEDAEKIIKSNKRMEKMHEVCKKYDQQQTAEDVKDDSASKASGHDRPGLRNVVFEDGKTYLTRGGKTFWPALALARPSKTVATVAGHVKPDNDFYKKNAAAEFRLYKARYPSAPPSNPLPFGKRAGSGGSSFSSIGNTKLKPRQLPIRQGKPKGSFADPYAPYPPPAPFQSIQPAQPRQLSAQDEHAAPNLPEEATASYSPSGWDNSAFASSNMSGNAAMPSWYYKPAQQTPPPIYSYNPTPMYPAPSNAHHGGALQDYSAAAMGTYYPNQSPPPAYPITPQSAPPFGPPHQPLASTHTTSPRCPDPSYLVASPPDAINARDLIPRGSTLVAEAAHVISVGLPPRYHTRVSGYTVNRVFGSPCEFECRDADGFVALGDHVAFYKF